MADIQLQAQGQGFVYALLTGLALGLFYDFFRIMRIFLRCRRVSVFFQDILYFALAGTVTFLLSLAVNYGEVRFYLLAGECIGVCVYFLTAGEITIRLARLILKALRAIRAFAQARILRPAAVGGRRFFRYIVSKAAKCKKLLKIRKEKAKTP